MLNKYYILIIILIILIPMSWVHALSEGQKGAILENFKKKQFELLFESDLGEFSSEYSDIFNISKKIDIYEDINLKVEKDKEAAYVEKEKLANKITSLQYSIEELNIDIKNTLTKVTNINKNVIQTKKEIEENTIIIKELQTKVKESREILLEYLIYLYKKGNTIYKDQEIDNIKSILLNEGDISELIDDLYYKGIIQIAGKKLLDDYKKNIADLYLKKVKLQKQEKDLKQLRKMGIIEKKILSDKKKFKERVLDLSKGEQSYFQKYIYDKLKIERKLQLRAFKEKVKFNSIRNKILKKYNCKFVDVSKNTVESRALSGKCLDINKMIYSESKLEKIKKTDGNFFSWPVSPTQGISAYFHDLEYKKTFKSEHEAIDIVTNQGTSIRAPADGYVVFIKPPESEDYAYIALKHHNGYMTIYGHISEALVKEFDYVKKGDIFAKTGGEFGTFGAGYLSSGPHLHFEVFRDKEYVDPYTVLDLSYIKYAKIPKKYKFKYYIDYKNRKGYEFKNRSDNSRVFKLKGDNEIERQKYLIDKYAIGSFKNWDMWVEESLDAGIDPSFVMCIALAETTLGKYLKTPYNIGNVGNTDSGATKTFPNARSGLYWMVKTLNNRYLGQYDEIRLLSRYGNKDPNKPIYASSPDNWHNNIIKCMSHLKGEYVPDNYNFRIMK